MPIKKQARSRRREDRCVCCLSCFTTRNSFCLGTIVYQPFEVFHEMLNVEGYEKQNGEWFYAL
jgi:hypothetical protein